MVDMNKVLELNPANGRAYMVIGVTYMHFGYPEEAIKYFDKAAEHEEIMRDWLYPMRADAKTSLRDYDGAIADWEKAIEVAKKGDDLDRVGKIEYIRSRINELQEAKKVFK